MNFKEEAQRLFKINDYAERVYFTSDNQAFFVENHAHAHSRNLDDKKIATIAREDVDTVTDPALVKLRLTAAMIAAMPPVLGTAQPGQTIEVSTETAEEYKAATAAYVETEKQKKAEEKARADAEKKTAAEAKAKAESQKE